MKKSSLFVFFYIFFLKINIVFQDGRNYLLTTNRQYDVITAEPPPPRTAFTVNLYTREYYELTKKALKPGGIVSQWIPLHSQTETHIYEHFRTFLESFPYVMSWYPTKQELILIGSNDPINIDFKKIEKRMKHPVVNEVMRKIKFENPFTLLGSIWFLENELKNMGSKQAFITDNNPSLEFFLNSPDVISRESIYTFLKNRTSFDTVFTKVKNVASADKKIFKSFWDQRINTEIAEDMFELGVQYYNKKNLRGALEKFKEAIKLNPRFVLAHFWLGNVLARNGDFKKAENHLRSAIKLKPDYAAAYNGLGNILTAQGNLEDALAQYITAIEKKPDYFDAHIDFGIYWDNRGDFSRALSLFKKAIQLQPQNAQGYFKLANSLYNNKKWEEAINNYRVALKLNPELTQARLNLDIVLRQVGNKK